MANSEICTIYVFHMSSDFTLYTTPDRDLSVLPSFEVFSVSLLLEVVNLQKKILVQS